MKIFHSEDGQLLHKFPLFVMKMAQPEQPNSPGPKIHFQPHAPASANDFIFGALYTPEDRMLYNLKITMTNATHNSLNLLSKTELSFSNATLPRTVDHLLVTR